MDCYEAARKYETALDEERKLGEAQVDLSSLTKQLDMVQKSGIVDWLGGKTPSVADLASKAGGSFGNAAGDVIMPGTEIKGKVPEDAVDFEAACQWLEANEGEAWGRYKTSREGQSATQIGGIAGAGAGKSDDTDQWLNPASQASNLSRGSRVSPSPPPPPPPVEPNPTYKGSNPSPY